MVTSVEKSKEGPSAEGQSAGRADLSAILNEAELAWYKALTDENYDQLVDGFMNKVQNKRIIGGRIDFGHFVKMCAQVGLRMQAKQDRKERKAFERLERIGNKR